MPEQNRTEQNRTEHRINRPRSRSLPSLDRTELGELVTLVLETSFKLSSRMEFTKKCAFPIQSAEDVYELLADKVEFQSERFYVICLNVRKYVIAMEELSRGTINRTAFDVMDILNFAIKHKAYGFIIAHNHPPGDPTPSQQDKLLTSQLAKAAKDVGSNFLDHVIIGTQGYYSFQEEGILN